MKFRIAILVCLATLSSAPSRASAPSAEEIMAAVDNIVSPGGDFSMLVTVTDREPGKEQKITRFKLLANGREQSLLMTLSPEGRRGRNLLYKGLDLWVYLPSVRRPFKISLQERLSGEASNSDLARANYSRDYNSRLLGIVEHQGKRCYQLELLAKTPDVPYQKVIMLARVEDNAPVKSEYYAVSGRALKECLYEDYRPFFGINRPTRLILRNSVEAGKSSVLQYTDWKEEPLPKKFFEKSYIDKMKY
jgi:outer membrane lipoprotein-sorting protein